jgi:Stress responsive A/B Barrel Domain
MFKPLILCAAAAALTACQSTPRHGIAHTVVLWLKEPGNAAHRATLQQVSESFRSIPGVRSVTAGPCIPSARPIVDSTFDTAVTLIFDSPEDLQRYLDHPRHKEATVSTLKPLVRKITVYDYRF